MSLAFEELDYQHSALGELILRRRRYPSLGELDVFEVILNDEFLMSSLFTAGEIALTDLGLATQSGSALDVLVGGLGLGYTAYAALERSEVQSLCVIEALPDVIKWHEQGLLPLGDVVASDARSSLHHGNFFALAQTGFSEVGELDRYHAILLDIDHSPVDVLHPDNKRFYSPAGLADLRACLHEDGVFALWSNDPPEEQFMMDLASVFAEVDARIIEIPNPQSGHTGYNTVYLAKV